MSAGNACAAIGLANTSKIPHIGEYVQDADGPPGPGADGPYIGVSGSSSSMPDLQAHWDRNVIGELVDPAFLVPADSGAAAGKFAHWVTTAAAPMTVAAGGLCDVSLGVVTALAVTGTYKTFIPVGTVIPAGSFLWVFEV